MMCIESSYEVIKETAVSEADTYHRIERYFIASWAKVAS